MRAVVLRDVGLPLEVTGDLEVKGPEAGEVRVSLGASGVCRSDLSLLDGTIPWPMPCVPGHEGAGTVVEVGSGVRSVGVGDRVILSWIPVCGRCFFCRRNESNLCVGEGLVSVGGERVELSGESISQGIGLGTFCEQTVVREESVVPIPEDVPIEVAALIGCGVMTGVGAAVNGAGVEPGARVAVFGCGGVGINVIQGARVCGAGSILAVDPVGRKREWAEGFGATDVCSPEDAQGVMEEVTGGVGFDYVFEVVGSPDVIRSAWDMTRRGGSLTVVGAGAPDALVSFSAAELFSLEKSVQGCLYGSGNVQRDFGRWVELWRTGRLDLEGLISKRIQVEEVPQAFDDMREGTVIRSVVVFD